MKSLTEDTNGSLYQAIHRLHFQVQDGIALLLRRQNLQEVVIDTNCSLRKYQWALIFGIVSTLGEPEDETL